MSERTTEEILQDMADLDQAMEKLYSHQEKVNEVTRVEVIDETGRGYVKYLKDDESVRLELQDDNRTLKVFVG